MNLQFIRDCPCKIDKKIINFKMGSFHDIDEKNAKWILDCGYAITHVEINEKALDQAFENKILESTENDKEIVQPKKRGRPRKEKE